MTNRELAALYRATSKGIADAKINLEAKAEVIKSLCRELKQQESRFNEARFTEACWGDDW